MSRPGLVQLLVAALAAGLTACGASPIAPGTAPGAMPVGPLSGAHSLAGVVVSNRERQPVPQAVVELTQGGISSAVTDAEGRFVFPSLPSGLLLLGIKAPNHLDRRSRVDAAAVADALTIDMIATAPPFNLAFYRQFVRNGHDAPGTLQALRRWTTDVRLYVNTTVEGSGLQVPMAIVDAMRAVFERSAMELSRGAVRIAAFEVGAEPRVRETGWVHVNFFQTLNGPSGRATVGGTSGFIELVYNPAASFTADGSGQCHGSIIRTAEHEITHTMGFWHTSDLEGFSEAGPGCSGQGRSERSLFHAAIAYTRPVGNTDPDADPGNVVLRNESERVADAMVSCWVGGR